MESYHNVSFQRPEGLLSSPFWDVCWHKYSAFHWQPACWGGRAGGRWNVRRKMQIQVDKRCREHVLWDSGNLDISQSQMNLSAKTAGQLWGYLKRRFREQTGVTSHAAGTVYMQLSGHGEPLLWLLSTSPVCEPPPTVRQTPWGWADTHCVPLVLHDIIATSSSSRSCDGAATRALISWTPLRLERQLQPQAFFILTSVTAKFSPKRIKSNEFGYNLSFYEHSYYLCRVGNVFGLLVYF